MTVYFNKARGHWTYDFLRAGTRHTGYCTDALGQPVTSRNAAKQAEGVEKRRAEMAGKVAKAGDYSLSQAIADLIPRWERQKDWKNKQRYIREIRQFFGSDTAVSDIGEGRIQDYIAYALKVQVTIWTGGPSQEGRERARFNRKTLDRLRSAGTVNLYLHLLRQIIGRASKVRDPITGEPAVKDVPKIPVLKTPKRKARPVPDNVLTFVRERVRDHTDEAIKLTLYFGLRQAECFGLQTFHADFAARGLRLRAEGVKDASDEFLPGSPAAMTFLAALVEKARSRETTFLITVRRLGLWVPIKSPKRAWATAMTAVRKRYGTKWRWHDIRAAYITHVALTSGPVMAQTLARHSDYETTRGYIEVADEMRAEAANRAADRPALKLVARG